MGRIKDIYIDQLNLEAAWLDLLEELFQKKGFAILSRDDRAGRRPEPDLAVKSDDEVVAVELKLHRSERVPLALIRNAFEQLEKMIRLKKAQRGILVIPQRLSQSHYSTFQRRQHELWDLARLIEEAKEADQHLAADLEELVRALRVGAERQPELPAGVAELGDVPSDDLPPIGAGTALAEQLEGLLPGKKDAQEFEKLCEKALRLLFDKDFIGWRSQSEIEHGFQRVDVIARLQPSQSAFWSTLSADFRTRYVVFEFKNYTDPITQEQVFTTEKYLLSLALRSVAVIIAKNGSAESADRAMRGALREGKLIMCINMLEFCGLLRGFDAGDNPEEVLIRKVDDLLMTIAR
jgi:Holliday junction resolvase